ncbi:U-box domain-containing protein 9 [Apostasia shenzhenica]|uniref:RING-type E3 ubiquitin transferase n=1 Tax=Apostasia shenzhenica TaxID=1088818 RepID=A0A2I0AVT1_9ASPA|nr:U-box domain-containing protein 9 [Apostasia shenzhenica]
MAKSGAAEGSVFDGRRMAEEERKKELRRLVEAIMEDDLGREEVYVDAERVIAALRELRVCAGRGLPGGKSSPATSGQERKQEKPAEDSTVEIDSGMAAPAKVPVPKHFLCPLSSAIMRDPVVVSSGETFDRAYIQEWLSSGKRTCPRTQQVLSNTILTPNHLVRDMIAQWCNDNGVILRQPENHENEGLITAGDRSAFSTLMADLCSPSHPFRNQAVKSLRQLTKRSHSFRAMAGENPAAIPQLLSILSEAGDDRELREDAVTALLNLSIHEPNKTQIGSESSGIALLIESVSFGGSMSTRGNAAAALFSLAALDSNKTKIGKLGAIPPLVGLLGTGEPAAKKDAASAIFNLCVMPENRARAVRAGAVHACLAEIADISSAVADESLSLLALLSADQEAAEAASEGGGVPILLNFLRQGKGAKSTENAVVVLHAVCLIDRRKLREVGEEETQRGTISEVAFGGTARAMRKAVWILERLKKTMHSDRHSY